jgi:hypothetical protein
VVEIEWVGGGGGTPPCFSDLWQGKDLEAPSLEVWQTKGLQRAEIADCRKRMQKIKDLRAYDGSKAGHPSDLWQANELADCCDPGSRVEGCERQEAHDRFSSSLPYIT